MLEIIRNETTPASDEQVKEKPTSERKIAANRRNGPRSKGPNDTTRSRFNAVKHGLAAGLCKLDFSAGYRELLEELLQELKPVGRLERCLVETIAFEMIRLPRARRMEAGHIDEWTYEPERPALYTGVMEPKLRVQREAVEPLLLYQRYETAISSKLHKAVLDLERKQRMRLALDIDPHKKQAESDPPILEQEFQDPKKGSVQ
jgi:hypothetical protein